MTTKELLTTRKRMWELEPIDQVRRVVLLAGIYAAVFVVSYLLLFPLLDKQNIVQQKAAAYDVVVSAGSRVNLGSMESDYSSGRYSDRTDEVSRNLRALLEGMISDYYLSEYSYRPMNDCIERFYVAATNSDETQALVRRSCGSYAHAPLFVAREGSDWRELLNIRADKVGIPECISVQDNLLDKEIVPVCGNWLDSTGEEVGS